MPQGTVTWGGQAPQGHRAAQKTVPGPASHINQCLRPCPAILAPGKRRFLDPKPRPLLPPAIFSGLQRKFRQGCFLLQLLRGSVWFSSSRQLLFALTQRFSEWDPRASRVGVTQHLLTCSLSPVPDPGWAQPPVFHKPFWCTLRCGTIASCHLSFWRREQTKHHHMGHCPSISSEGTWGCEGVK